MSEQYVLRQPVLVRFLTAVLFEGFVSPWAGAAGGGDGDGSEVGGSSFTSTEEASMFVVSMLRKVW